MTIKRFTPRIVKAVKRHVVNKKIIVTAFHPFEFNLPKMDMPALIIS